MAAARRCLRRQPIQPRSRLALRWRAECTDEKRLDVHNGLLLSALWDAAFDRGLISFADDGAVLARPNLGAKARDVLGFGKAPRLPGLLEQHRTNLALHRRRNGL